jgi:hypothetical protein
MNAAVCQDICSIRLIPLQYVALLLTAFSKIVRHEMPVAKRATQRNQKITLKQYQSCFMLLIQSSADLCL